MLLLLLLMMMMLCRQRVGELDETVRDTTRRLERAVADKCSLNDEISSLRSAAAAADVTTQRLQASNAELEQQLRQVRYSS